MTAAPSSTTTDLLSEFSSPSLSPSLLQSLLHRLLSDPSIHNGFIDILHLPTVQSALANNPQRDVIVRTLELFGYGTVDEYYELKDAVMNLNDVQLEKLRMLSVVSVAKQRIEDARGTSDGDDVDMTDSKPVASPKKLNRTTRTKRNDGLLSISYSELATKLHLPDDDVRNLEDLLIQCIYANLLSARLDQCSKCLVIDPRISIVRENDHQHTTKNSKKEIHGSILSRDQPSSPAVVSKMISRLESFLSHSESLLSTLESCTQINTVIRKSESIRWNEVNRILNEGNANAKFGALERDEMMENTTSSNSCSGERGPDRREVKRSKMQNVMMQRFT